MAPKPKNILLLGGTGPSGLLTLKLALEHGHNVTVYARNPKKIPEELSRKPNIKIITGSLDSTETLYPLLPETDTIISLLGPSGIRHKGTPIASFYSSLLTHLKSTSQNPHILAMNTISSDLPTDSYPFLASLLVNMLWLLGNGAYTEVRAIGKVFKEEGGGIPWTNWRCAYLGDGERGEECLTGRVGEKGWGLRIEKRELAAWLVGEAERGVEESRWIGEMPALFSAGGKKAV